MQGSALQDRQGLEEQPGAGSVLSEQAGNEMLVLIPGRNIPSSMQFLNPPPALVLRIPGTGIPPLEHPLAGAALPSPLFIFQ